MIIREIYKCCYEKQNSLTVKRSTEADGVIERTKFESWTVSFLFKNLIKGVFYHGWL